MNGKLAEHRKDNVQETTDQALPCLSLAPLECFTRNPQWMSFGFSSNCKVCQAG